METTCVHYSREYVGSPCIVAIDRDRCVVADGTGNLTAVDLKPQVVGPRLFVGVSGGMATNLRSLRSTPARPWMVAVATRGAYAAIGDLEQMSVAKIHPVEGGTVQAVAISPDGCTLAIGTGSYTAAGPPPAAGLELWDLSPEGGPRFVVSAAMPGACLDAVMWSPDGARIACALGMRLQKTGFVAQFDAARLRALSYFETPFASASRLGYLDGNTPASRLAVALRGGFRVLDAVDGTEAWRIDRPESPDVPLDFDVLADEGLVVLNSGLVLDVRDGSTRSRFLAMNDCTSIAARPGGGFIGASNRGRIYCWD